ncbi:MAG: sugar phosphate nucleotidyltransferase [Syntrophobacteraceae bacterium]
MKAIIQAGGKGTRLRPYTHVMPKPLMPVGDLPVVEITLKYLRRWGIRDVFITTGYLGHLIRSLCSDGHQWDMNISYTREPEPLGTVGALHLLNGNISETFLTLNGDLITDLNLRDFVNFHRQNGGILTIAATQKVVKIDLGVLDCETHRMIGFREKPVMSFTVSMGIYCMEPELLEIIPRGVPFGFDDLVHELMSRGERINVYEHHGLWLDIGREEDFMHAQNAFVKDFKCQVLGC